MTAVDTTCESTAEYSGFRDRRVVMKKRKHATKATNDDRVNFEPWPVTGEKGERATRPVEQEVLQRGRFRFAIVLSLTSCR